MLQGGLRMCHSKNFSCFASFSKNSKECKVCEYAKACKFTKEDNLRYKKNNKKYINKKSSFEFNENQLCELIKEAEFTVQDELNKVIDYFNKDEKPTLLEVIKLVVELSQNPIMRAVLYTRLFEDKNYQIDDLAGSLNITKQALYKAIKKTIYKVLEMKQDKKYLLRDFKLTPFEYSIFFYREIEKLSLRKTAIKLKKSVGTIKKYERYLSIKINKK